MSAAIWVEKLSKQYKLGHAHPTLRDRISSMMTLDILRKKPEEETLWALRDVSLSVEHGETVGIIGRNGAGKSTLLKILSKITYPTYGSTGIDGRVISLLEVGTGFHDELTGRENIYLNGSILGMPKKEVKRQLDAIVEFAGLKKFIDTPIKRFSSGMRLRLGFAVAAHLDPDILIVDEVLAVGDAEFQKKCLDTIQKLRASARTILFVSHNLAAVENICERCIWIDHGEVHMDGKCQDVIKDYMGSMRKSPTVVADLEETQNRRGNGKIRFQGLEFLSSEGISQKVIRAGDSVVMRFHYCAHEPVAFPSIGFRMHTETGVLITETSTSHHGIYIPSVALGAGYLDLKIDCLNLLAAKYTISLWATDQHGGVIYDHVENAVTFEVDAANPYGSNFLIDGRFGIVFFPQKWNLAGMSDPSESPLSGAAELKEALARDDK
jgi:lipopolysaccharide transport system ATP-binding protein